MSQLFRKKSIDALIASSEESGHKLKRSLGLWSLVGLGVGSVIGSGIFTLTGTAAAGTSARPGAGPAIALSFLLVALACSLAALCYAELASMIPVAGSAYTYTYATLGEFFAWLIGWNLILEYAVSNMSVAVGFGAYFNDLFQNLFGFTLPPAWSAPPFIEGQATGAIFNLPALLVLIPLTWVLVRGIRESAETNNTMVVIKIAAILLFVFGAARAVNPTNWHPFMPHGFSGVLTGGALVFFTYIGFDSVSTAAEECEKPQRDMPLGILITLGMCALLYVSVSLVLTGIEHYSFLNNDAPVANALKKLGYDKLRLAVTVGALVGMISSLMAFQYGQTRIWFAMSRDRLFPEVFSRVHPKFQTPHWSTIIAGVVVGIPAGLFDIGTLAEVSNLGTLCAFAFCSAGVLALRHTQPERRRPFRVPFAPVVCTLSIICCLVLAFSLPVKTWIVFFTWLAIGQVIYFTYSRHRAAKIE
jgi:APA family basic amino acid/polyamine antiporter